MVRNPIYNSLWDQIIHYPIQIYGLSNLWLLLGGFNHLDQIWLIPMIFESLKHHKMMGLFQIDQLEIQGRAPVR